MNERAQTVLAVLTLVWLTTCAIRAASQIGSRRRSGTLPFVLIAYWVFYAFPIAMDLFIGPPTYANYPGFRLAAASSTVALLYYPLICFYPVFWYMTVPRRGPVQPVNTILPTKKIQPIFWIIVASPLIALPFAPDPGAYLSYAAVLQRTLSDEATTFHMLLGALSTLSVIAAAGLLLIRKHFARTLWLILPFITADVWVQGKRSIMALTIVLLWSAASLKGLLTRSRMISYGTFTLALFVMYVTVYQMWLRPNAVRDSLATYEYSRIDWGRDHNLKSVLFCELSDGTFRILQHRGQTILFYLTMYVPRSAWPDKPLPYAPYLTAFGLRARAQDFGWGITTSILDEMIANAGWLGVLLGPLLITVMCRLSDGADKPGQLVGSLVNCLFLAVELSAFAPLLFLWLAYLAWLRSTTRKRARRLRLLLHRATRFEVSQPLVRGE